MTLVAGLYKQTKHDRHDRTAKMDQLGLPDIDAIQRSEEKKKAKAAKEMARQQEEERRRQEKANRSKAKRAPFNFEQVGDSSL